MKSVLLFLCLSFFFIPNAYSGTPPELFDYLKSTDAPIYNIQLDSHFEETRVQVPEAERSQAWARIHSILNGLFGSADRLKTQDWPYFLEGYTTKLLGIEIKNYPESVGFELQLFDERGEPVTSQWIQRWYSLDGMTVLEGEMLRINNQFRRASADSIGLRLNQQRVEFLKKYAPETGALMVKAQLVGSYRWAVQGYRFVDPGVGPKSSGEHSRQEMRKAFSEFLAKKRNTSYSTRTRAV